MLPGSFEQATADAGTAFEQELPALEDWRFTAAEAFQPERESLDPLHLPERLAAVFTKRAGEPVNAT